MPGTFFNIVTFNANGTRIALTLDGPWRLSAGMKPDTNSALVPYTEWDKLGVPDEPGTIEFWFTSAPGDAEGDPGVGGQPDVSLAGWRIVEVKIGKTGIPLGATAPRVLEYHVFFQDGREQFVEPRGGRVRLGLINAGPVPSDPGTTGVPEMLLSELIQECCKRMGSLVDATVPADVDNIDPPRDLKWFGNHAPAELAKLMDLAGLVFCPQSDGTFNIQQVTNQGNPQIAGGTMLPQVQMPAIDRRAKTVIFSSFPMAALETLTLEGPRDDQWQFVVQDSKGAWQTPDKCDLVNAKGGLLKQWQKKFADVPLQYGAQITGQAYRFIRLGDGSNPPAGTNSKDTRPLPPAQQSPVLNKLINQDGTPADVTVMAKVALYDLSSRQYSNATSPVAIAATHKADSNIVELSRPLLQVSRPTTDIWGDAQEPRAGDLQVTFTIPVYDRVTSSPSGSSGSPASTWQPRYFHCGFQRIGGQVVQLSDDDVANAMDGGTRDAIVIPCGELLRLRIYNHNPSNQSGLVAMARGWADKLLANADRPMRVFQAVGFAACEISGLVSEVEWNQERVETAVGVNNWYRPQGAIDTAALGQLERGGGGDAGGGAGGPGGAFPLESITQATRQSLGEPGATQPMVPLIPTGHALPDPETVTVQVGANIAAGVYAGTMMSGLNDQPDAQNLTLADEGMTAGASCLLFVSEEDSAVTDGKGNTYKGAQRLMQGSTVTGKWIGMTNEDTPRPIVLIVNGVGLMTGGASPGLPGTHYIGTTSVADTETWSKLASGTPITVTVVTRVTYDSASKNLYAFTRTLYFDARGLLYYVDGEERITIMGGC